MRGLFCAFAFALIATPALAQQTPISSPSPASTPAPSAAATALIAAADAQGVFEALASDNQIAVRHMRSGLTCRMDTGDANRLVVFPQAARGEDVACEASHGRVSVKLYATRYSFRTTVTEQVAGTVAVIQQRYPDARPFQMTLRGAGEGLPPSQSAHFLITEGGAQEYTRVSIAMIRGWAFKLRYTAPAASDAAAQQAALAADRLWAQTLTEIARPH
jgi:hypothetical protein